MPSQQTNQTTDDQSSQPGHTSKLFFAGSISEAIQHAQLQQKLLLIFVQGKNENSQKLLQQIIENQNRLIDLFKKTVAIHLVEGTTNFQYFTQFSMYMLRKLSIDPHSACNRITFNLCTIRKW